MEVGKKEDSGKFLIFCTENVMLVQLIFVAEWIIVNYLHLIHNCLFSLQIPTMRGQLSCMHSLPVKSLVLYWWFQCEH